jgi:phospholipid/cholesterol/gamma-HCH transport system substrate-binding protein
MSKHTIDNVRLGLFVLAGTVLLILGLYVIGKDYALFETTFPIKARFENVGGLVAGHNVRFAGITVGTVKSVEILNDTTIEVVMHIKEEMRQVIRKNSIASLGTDGIVGNKIIILEPVKEPAPFIEAGDIMRSKEEIKMSEIMETLRRTNENVAVISESLVQTVQRINSSAQLAVLLDDTSLSDNLRAALINLRTATREASTMMQDLHHTLGGIERGEGTVGVLLKDTSLAHQLDQAVRQIQTAASEADQLANDLSRLSNRVENDFQQGSGPVQSLLRDSAMTAEIQSTLRNVEKGTAAFHENMEALKHNFLLRRYFKKQAKQKNPTQQN